MILLAFSDAVSPKINAIPIVELADYVKTHQVSWQLNKAKLRLLSEAVRSVGN